MKYAVWLLLMFVFVAGFSSSRACTNPVITATHFDVACNGLSTGSINITPNYGNPPYSYSWTGPNGFTSNLQNLTGLAAGSYTVVVSGGGCSSSATITINQPAALTAAPSGLICIGTGISLAANPSGGTAPYTYTWTGPNSFSSTSQNPTTSVASTSNAGTYSVTVKDANLCSVTSSVAVNAYYDPTLSTHATSVSCNGGNNGSVSLSVSGATGYTYLWTGPNGYTNTGQNIASLVAGVYTVVVTANTGCTATNSDTVVQFAAVTATASSNSPICSGNALNLSGTAGGGNGTYTYTWTGPNGFYSTSLSPTLSSVNVNQSGTYYLTVKDGLQCTHTAAVNVSVINSGTLVDTVTNVTCNGGANGAINIGVSGGTGTASYFWSGPNWFYSSSQNISGLVAGNYGVDVSMSQGCIAHLNVYVAQPAAIQITASSGYPLCSGGTLHLSGSATAGVGTLSYLWTGPNGFSTATQNATIPSVNFGTSGNYVLTVTDANNCKNTDTLLVNVDSIPTLNITHTDVLCYGGNTGSINVSSTGSGPFTYSWTGPGSYISHLQNIGYLATGVYNVTVTSAVGCVASAATYVNQPPPITATASATDSLCAGGVINMTGAATGGVGNFSYSWNGPNGFIAQGQSVSLTASTTAAGGNYIFIARDLNGCLKTVTVPVAVIPAPVFSDTLVTPLCNGNTNGKINIGTTGGRPPFNYQWAGPSSFTATTKNISNLAGGIYYLTVTGGCNATYIDTITLNQPAVLGGNINLPATCMGDTLRAAAQITGGTQPYSYSWSGPASFTANTANAKVPYADSLNAGTYMLTIHDAHNCTFTDSAVGTIKPVPVVAAGDDTAICTGNTVVLNAGNTGSMCIWNTGDTSHAITVSQTGWYIATVTAQNGCSTSDTVVVRVDSTPHIDGINVSSATSIFTFTPLNPQDITNYWWDFGDGSGLDTPVARHNYMGKGAYTVTLIGSNACGSDTVTIIIQVDTLSGVANVLANDGISIYPNPASGLVFVSSPHAHLMQMRLVTMAGAQVRDEHPVAGKIATVDVSELPAGMYILYLYTSEGMAARKITVARQ